MDPIGSVWCAELSMEKLTYTILMTSVPMVKDVVYGTLLNPIGTKDYRGTLNRPFL